MSRVSYDPLDPDNWLAAVFSAKAVGRGGVIHRATKDIERFVGRERFIREVHKRGFTLVENGTQLVVFCNRDAVRLIVERDPPKLSERAYPVFRRSDPMRRAKSQFNGPNA